MVFDWFVSWFVIGMSTDNRISGLLYLGTNRGLKCKYIPVRHQKITKLVIAGIIQDVVSANIANRNLTKVATMSNMKCPFCQQELDKDPDGYYTCYTDNCGCWANGGNGASGSESLWLTLIRTRKALDKAKWWLNEIVESHRCTPISTAEMALKEITAQEQKDVK